MQVRSRIVQFISVILKINIKTLKTFGSTLKELKKVPRRFFKTVKSMFKLFQI